MNPWKGLSGLPRASWVLFGATTVNRAGSMVRPYLLVYLISRLGVSRQEAGLCNSLFGVGAMVISPLAGLWCDRFGTRAVMIVSQVVAALAFVLLPTADSLVTVIPLVLLLAFATESFRPASIAAVTGAAPVAKRQAAFVLNRMAINLGMSIGPVAGGYIAEVSYLALFVVNGTTSLLCVAMLCFLPAAPRRAAAKRRTATTAPLFDRTFLWFLLCVTLLGTVFFQFEAALLLFVKEALHASEADYGNLCLVNTVLILLCEVRLNLAMTRWPMPWLLAAGTLLAGLGFLVMGLWPTLVGAVAGMVVLTVGEMIMFPTVPAYVSAIAPADRQGEAMGWMSMAFGMSLFLAPNLGTDLFSRLGGLGLWSCIAGLGAVTALLFLALPHGRPPRPAGATGSSVS
jgi:MFS family permease